MASAPSSNTVHPDNNSRVPDAHIIRRHEAEGKSPAEIAALLGISAQSVRNVLAGFAEKGQPVDFGLPVLEVIRNADSPDQKWPAAELINAFHFSTRVRRAVENHCEGKALALLSLRDLFGIFVSDESTRRPEVVITPFLGFRNGGEKSFWETVDQITRLDMGQAANALWRLKLNLLAQASRIKAPEPYSWSKPVRPVKTP